MEKKCAVCGRVFEAKRRDTLYCGAKCRWTAFYTILHPGRSRRGGKHKPRPRQPETERGGTFAAGSYYDMPTTRGFDEGREA